MYDLTGIRWRIPGLYCGQETGQGRLWAGLPWQTIATAKCACQQSLTCEQMLHDLLCIQT